ncbi:sperm mitochondrial-associated cysteine-rich protein-like [Musca vetustissima]|uniref:sperm mitochondrial-associated cysteine-rich protein-like n=1 Tax=Musca vetustissima TaxID=27455 RepID=UPI002AB7ED08|nr:sperm mitochondrial-associated cysteine-rich protein-like [Musca vetustissima]
MCDPCCPPCGPCGPCSPCDPCCAPFEPKSCRSHELRSGIMYTTCDCIKRNGLQDKCPRSQCQGRSACMCLPTPNCCPAAFPLRFANMTMGVKKRRGGGNSCSPPGSACPPPCGSCDTCCGPSNPMGAAPSPVPYSPSPNCCPPLPEAGIPDPRIWNACNTPPCYPCKFEILFNFLETGKVDFK